MGLGAIGTLLWHDLKYLCSSQTKQLAKICCFPKIMFPEVQQRSLIHFIIISHYFWKENSCACQWIDDLHRLNLKRLLRQSFHGVAPLQKWHAFTEPRDLLNGIIRAMGSSARDARYGKDSRKVSLENSVSQKLLRPETYCRKVRGKLQWKYQQNSWKAKK